MCETWRGRESVCDTGRERESVCVRQRGRESVSERERERERAKYQLDRHGIIGRWKQMTDGEPE